MEIPLSADVLCSDGPCGESTCVILKKNTEEVTHLVVKEAHFPHEEVLVPLTAVKEASADSIRLRYAADELPRLDPFVETEYTKVDIARYSGGAFAPMPLVWEDDLVPVERESVPIGERHVHRGARVLATDGTVGRVEEFVLDPRTQRLTHLVLRQGHFLFGEKDVTVPVSEIDRIEGNRVYLKLDKRRFDALPALPIRGDPG